MNKQELLKIKLKSIIIDLLTTGYDIIEFGLINTNEPEEKKKYGSLLRKYKKAIRIIEKTQHIDILSSLYNSFISGKESYFVVLCLSIIKNVEKWDTTKSGYQEFLSLEEEARAKFKEESEERMKTQESINKAREEGKKVEMVFDNGKIKPVVVDEKTE